MDRRGNPNRWLIAMAGVVMQIALGAVYAWSMFRIPLTTTYGRSIPQVTLTFEIAILTLGIASFLGGLWMKRVGPRRVALVAGLCYGLGTILAGQAHGSIVMLDLSYGLLGGIGLGLGYIVPLATLIRWFPDRRGMITGLAVAGSGAGALVYGLMLTAWGVAGVLGPTLIALIRQATGHYTGALEVIATLMLASAVIPLVVRPLGGATSALVPPYRSPAMGRNA